MALLDKVPGELELYIGGFVSSLCCCCCKPFRPSPHLDSDDMW